jgi:outer membrane protein
MTDAITKNINEVQFGNRQPVGVIYWIGIIVLIGAVVISVLLCQMLLIPKIGYVDTGKLLVGFSEANKVEREIKAEDDKWQAQLKMLQDSLQATINAMSKDYDKSTIAKKKEFQDLLSARNQQVNNFRQANIKKSEELRAKKMQGVFNQVNVYMAEYGKKHGYSIVFGTAAGGSILYGNERKYDITEDIIKGLNERYK